MRAAANVYEAPYTSQNGRRADDRLRDSLHLSLGERILRMAKQPTTTPRWLAIATHGALILTIVVGLISYGRSAGRTEAALNQVKELPQLQANVDSTTAQLKEIKALIEKQGTERANQDKRIDAIQQQTTLLTQQINSLTNSFGSVWALAQSDSNKMSKLEGMLTAMQLQNQQRKDK
jgi:NAD/NADP transhydrogenase beta subunit